MNLKQLRLSKGLKQNFVANKLGVSQRHFQRMEEKGDYLDKERIKKLAVIYGTTIKDVNEILKDGEGNVI